MPSYREGGKWGEWGTFNNQTHYPLAVVLFDGAGLSARGLRMAGFRTWGIELNPVAHRMAEAILAAEVKLEGADSPAAHSAVFLMDVLSDRAACMMRYADVIWASPPCQLHSQARTQGAPVAGYADDLLGWSLRLPEQYPNAKAIWIENVTKMGKGQNDWGIVFNAHQFGTDQNRNRVIAGRFPQPETTIPYKKTYKGVCPTITATEFKGCASDKRRASRFYGRKLTLHECAYHMDMEEWMLYAIVTAKPDGVTQGAWATECYRAIGNGVPLKMAYGFGEAAQKLLDIETLR